MREANATDALDRAEEKLSSELALVSGLPARVVAGRIFRLEDGVWKDAAHPQGRVAVRIRAFSEAYFRLLVALPEVKPVLSEMPRVLISGRDVSVEVGDQGVETRTEARMRDIVRGSRGAPARP